MPTVNLYITVVLRTGHYFHVVETSVVAALVKMFLKAKFYKFVYIGP